MKKLVLIIVLLSASVVSAQVSSSTARRVRGGNTPPATCKATAPADVFIDTDAAVGSRLLVCTSANTWTAQGASAGVAGSTGSTDNRVLRADGTGGATVQSSLVGIDDTAAFYFSGTDGNAIFGSSDNSSNASVLISQSAGTYVRYGGNRIGAGGASNFVFVADALTYTFAAGGLTGEAGTIISTPKYATATNCSDSAGAAACGSAAAGSFVVDASTTSTVVSTTAVTANSQIMVQTDSSLGTRLSVTCNTQSSLTLGSPRITARTAGTSFTVTIEAGPTTNPLCLSYHIIN